jgi:dCMP deaminase
MTVIDWTDYFIEIAKTVSLRSNCIRKQVGAIIVDKAKKIKASGYNGVPTKVLSCREKGFCYRMENNIESGTQYETCRSIHAEQNAIIQAGEEKCQGSIMYVFGHDFICILCERFIVQAGITDIYLKKDNNSKIIHVLVENLRTKLSDPKTV